MNSTKLPVATTPTMLELYKLLVKSEKFLKWKPNQDKPDPIRPQDPAVYTYEIDEKHFTPQELANAWGVSVQTIREIFKNEDGVLKLGSNGTRNRRAYKTLRIPYSVAERVHTRFSA